MKCPAGCPRRLHQKGRSMETKSNFKVLSAVRHDGMDYAEGDTISLTEKEAEPLLQEKVIAPAEKKK